MSYLQQWFLVVLLVLTFSLLSDASPAKPVCGYQACPKTKRSLLNVHLVAHSHDDVGWLKTVDQYFYGAEQPIQNAGVQYIIDSAIKELAFDRKKRFIYVEMAFLWQWWLEQDDKMRQIAKKLVNNGQLEIISGGWSMNDEAATHYQSIIDQLSWGFSKSDEMFGACGRPHIGWQIDPFGHSREQASIFAQMGFDGLFIGRLDYQDKDLRLAKKTAEMVWRGSPTNLGSSSDLFTHILYNNYSPPPGFCFELLCLGEPMVDNMKSRLYNVPKKVTEFIDYVMEQSTHYSSNNIIITMGMDFHFQAAGVFYKNLDKLIEHVNAKQKHGSKVNVFYSSPSCYLKAVHESNISYTTKQDDFFPYSDGIHAFWTGYYTSKPTIKYFERLGNNFLQVCKQLYALARLSPKDGVGLDLLREAMGIMQHHDAITGTEKEHVAADYNYRMTEGFHECGRTTNLAINKLFVSEDDTATPPPVPLESCLLLNVSQCEISETSKSFVVTVYNPLARPLSHYVRLPVASKSAYSVRDPTGAEQTVQMVPIHDVFTRVPGRNSKSSVELVFRAKDLPPLGFRSYFVATTENVAATKNGSQDEPGRSAILEANDRGSIGNTVNKKLNIELDEKGSVTVLHGNGVSTPLNQSFGFYVGYVDKQSGYDGRRSSGAYVFRPSGELKPIEITSARVYKGPLVEEVHQTYGDGWIGQTIRIYVEENHAEFEWQVGPIPIKDDGMEVVSRYSTDLKSKGVFYTDSNGREMIKRVRDHRPTWNVTLKEKIAGNYYPVTTRILIRDEEKNQEIAVLPDRAEGGSSIHDGEIELMLHRHLLVDDGLGVSEPLKEVRFGVGLAARGRHFVMAGPTTGVQPSLAAQERALVQGKLLQPWVFLSNADNVTFEQWKDKYKMEYSGVTAALPDNVHLLTLEPWKDRSLLVRLEHILEKGEDDELSQSATVNLKQLFSSFLVSVARETTLGGNQWLENSGRLQWQTKSMEDRVSKSKARSSNKKAVTLEPMQIRTFVVETTGKRSHSRSS